MSPKVLVPLVGLHLLAAWIFLGDAGLGFPLDDAWLHMVYARALGLGEGFAYNPGQLETGVTAPLWTALLAVPVTAARLLGERPDLFVRVCGGLCGLLLSLCAWRLGGRAGRWPAAFAALATTFDPWMTFERFAGMEAPLFGVVLLLLLGALLDKSAVRVGVLCGLLVLLRPEGLVVAGFSAIWLWRKGSNPGRMLVPLLVCLLPWMAYCGFVSERPWPSTFDTKAGMVLDPSSLWMSASAILGDLGWGWALPLALVIGVISLEGGRRDLGRLPVLVALVLGVGVLLSRPLLVAPATERVPYYWARYALLAWPPILFVAAAGVASLVRTAYAGVLCRPLFGALLVAPLAVVLVAGRALPRQMLAMPARFAAECADVETLHVAAGRWVAEHTDPDDLVATHDAGAIRYFGGRRVLDLFGNHDHRLLRLEREQGPDAVVAEIVARRPDVLIVFPVLWAHGQGPETNALWQSLPPQEWAAIAEQAQDWAGMLGLTRRAATFHVDEPACVPDPLHADLAVFVRP